MLKYMLKNQFTIFLAITLCCQGPGLVNKGITAETAASQGAAPLSVQAHTHAGKFKLKVQPGSKAEFYAGETKLKPKKIYAEKTASTFEFLQEQIASAGTLIIKHNGYLDQQIKINFHETDKKSAARNFPLVVLDKPESKHRFIGAYQTGPAPKSVTFLDNNRVIVAQLNGKAIDVINIETGQTQQIAPPANYAKKEGFVESIVLRKHREFWVSQMQTSSVHVFSADDLSYKTTIKLKGKWSKVLAYDELRDRVYISNWNTLNISVVSVPEKKELRTVKLSGVPRGMAFTPDYAFLYAAIFGSDTDSDRGGKLLKIDLETFKVVKTFPFGGAQRHIIRFQDNPLQFYASDMAGNRVRLIADDKVKETVKVFNNPNTIALSADKAYLYVSCRGPNNPKSYLIKGHKFGQVHVINTATNTTEEVWEGGNQPTGLDVSPDGKYVVFSDFLDDLIRVYKRTN